jgi:hypothetical protein
VFQKELYNVIPNVTVWPVLRKLLHLKTYKLFIVQGVERWIVCTPLSSLPFSQEPASRLYLKPYESSVNSHVIYLIFDLAVLLLSVPRLDLYVCTYLTGNTLGAQQVNIIYSL